LKGEYLYADVGPGRSLMPNAASVPVNTGYQQGGLSEKVLRAGINYKFDWLGGTGSAATK
jgi:hypothetical protein